MNTTFILKDKIVSEEEIKSYLKVNPNEKGFAFEIKEELRKRVEVYGQDREDSEFIVDEKYYDGQISLNESDFYENDTIINYKGIIG